MVCGVAVDGLGRKEGRKRVLLLPGTSFLEEALESGLAEKEGSSAKGGGAGAAAAAAIIHNGGIMAGCDVNHLVRHYCLRASPWCYGQAQPGKLLLLCVSFSLCLSHSLPIFSASKVRGRVKNLFLHWLLGASKPQCHREAASLFTSPVP